MTIPDTFQLPIPQIFTIPEPNNIFDNILANHFKNFTGRFLGIGANVGLDWGFPLLEHGWTGIYCEPDPIACAELIRNTEQFRNTVSVVNTAIMPTTGLRPFYLSLNSSYLSSMDPDHLENVLLMNNFKWDSHPVKVPILTNAIAFQDFINYVGNDFDLIVIDAEGVDIELATSIDWSQFSNCKLVSLEHGYPGNIDVMNLIKQLWVQANFKLTDIAPGHAVYRR